MPKVGAFLLEARSEELGGNMFNFLKQNPKSLPGFILQKQPLDAYTLTIPDEEFVISFTPGTRLFSIPHRGKEINTHNLDKVSISPFFLMRLRTKFGFSAHLSINGLGIGIITTAAKIFIFGKMNYMEWRGLLKEHT